jgi:hypothetical protein
VCEHFSYVGKQSAIRSQYCSGCMRASCKAYRGWWQAKDMLRNLDFRMGSP